MNWLCNCNFGQNKVQRSKVKVTTSRNMIKKGEGVYASADCRRIPSTPCLKKTVQKCFCQNFVKFPPILIVFGRKMEKKKLEETVCFCYMGLTKYMSVLLSSLYQSHSYFAAYIHCPTDTGIPGPKGINAVGPNEHNLSIGVVIRLPRDTTLDDGKHDVHYRDCGRLIGKNMSDGT